MHLPVRLFQVIPYFVNFLSFFPPTKPHLKFRLWLNISHDTRVFRSVVLLMYIDRGVSRTVNGNGSIWRIIQHSSPSFTKGGTRKGVRYQNFKDSREGFKVLIFKYGMLLNN